MVLKSLCGASSSSLFIFSTGVTGGGGWVWGSYSGRDVLGPRMYPMSPLGGFPICQVSPSHRVAVLWEWSGYPNLVPEYPIW